MPPVAADSTTVQPLLDHHREHLRASGLIDATVAAYGVSSVIDEPEAARLLNWKGPGGPAPAIALLVYGFNGEVVQTVLRPDNPRTREDGSVAKYEQPLGEHHRVCFPPTSLVEHSHLLDLQQPLIFTEGIKKALAATQAGSVALSMQGVSVWHDAEHREANRGKPGEWRLHRDLLPLPLRKRRVYIAFDGGDTTENPPVILAEARLTRMLLDAGADVRLVRFPHTPGGAKVGLDDFLAKLPESERAAALEKLCADALPGDPLDRIDLALAADDPERTAIALLDDPSFAAALRVADRAVENVARKKLRAAGVLRDAVHEAAARFGASLGATEDKASVAPGLHLKDPEPAKEPQDTGALLGELTAIFKRHVILPAGAAIVLALWCLHTWVLGASEFTPRLALTSPTKRCGKTRVLDLLRELCRRPIQTANVSAAALYRAVEAAHPSLLIDEADSFLAGNEDLRGIINAGYRFDGSVLRCVGDEHEPTEFSCFAPAAIAAIHGLPGTIADRSLDIRMERRPKAAKVARIDRETRRSMEAIRPRIARWADDNLNGLRGARPKSPEALNDRQAEITEPLLAIADLADMGDEARTALEAICGAEATDPAERSERLLGAVWAIFNPEPPVQGPAPSPPEFLALKAIVGRLLDDETGGWDTAAKGKAMTTAHLSRWLGSFGLLVRQSRAEPGRPRGYFCEDLAPVVARYGAERPPQTENRRDGVTDQQPQGGTEDSGDVTPVGRHAGENERKPNGENGCHAVTPEKRGSPPSALTAGQPQHRKVSL